MNIGNRKVEIIIGTTYAKSESGLNQTLLTMVKTWDLQIESAQIAYMCYQQDKLQRQT